MFAVSVLVVVCWCIGALVRWCVGLACWEMQRGEVQKGQVERARVDMQLRRVEGVSLFSVWFNVCVCGGVSGEGHRCANKLLDTLCRRLDRIRHRLGNLLCLPGRLSLFLRTIRLHLVG